MIKPRSVSLCDSKIARASPPLVANSRSNPPSRRASSSMGRTLSSSSARRSSVAKFMMSRPNSSREAELGNEEIVPASGHQGKKSRAVSALRGDAARGVEGRGGLERSERAGFPRASHDRFAPRAQFTSRFAASRAVASPRTSASQIRNGRPPPGRKPSAISRTPAARPRRGRSSGDPRRRRNRPASSPGVAASRREWASVSCTPGEASAKASS